MQTLYRKSCAALAWTTLILQYTIMVSSGEFGGFASSTLTYLGYFTILTNILVALSFSVPFMRAESQWRVFFERQTVRAATALYILVVTIVYYALLAKIHNPVGLSAVLNVGLHFLLPVLYILDWLIFAQKDSMSFKHLPLWTAFPVAYGVFNIIRGALTGFYPYPFLNITELGFGAVFINMLGFMLIYAIGGAIFIMLGRRMKSAQSLKT